MKIRYVRDNMIGKTEIKVALLLTFTIFFTIFFSGSLFGCSVTFKNISLKDVTLKETFKVKEQAIISSMSKTTSVFPLVTNERVDNQLEKLKKSPYSIKKWLSRSKRYEALMKGIFIGQGIPEDMFYVAILESGFDPHSISSKGAGGPWQFIPTTASRMGMRIDEWVDERKDYEKSTRYAAKYFAYFHRSFDDWYLALAGYNCGGAPVRKAIKKCGDVSIWEMADQGMLTFQARGYVPRIIAITMIMLEPEKFGFEHPAGEKPMTYDKIYVPGGLPLSFFANTIKVKTKTLTTLNPELLKEMTPPGAIDYELKIPPGKKLLYLKGFDEAYVKYRGVFQDRGD